MFDCARKMYPGTQDYIREMSGLKKISIVVPCYNEEQNVEPLYCTLRKELESLEKYEWEIIFSDNASTDGTANILRELAKQDMRVKVIINLKNYGPARSSKNAMFHASGDAVIHLASDFQEPPELIHLFLAAWEDGYDVVWGQKLKRDEGVVRDLCRRIYYEIIGDLSSDKQYKQVTGFGLYSREVVEMVKATEEQEMSLRHLIPQLGYDVKLIPYEQPPRREGKSSYNLRRYFNFAITSLVTTSKVPLRLATLIGLFSAALSFGVCLFYFIYKLLHWSTFSAGMAPLVIGIFFLGSVQLVFIGVIGEYIGVLFDKASKRPLVIEKETINMETVFQDKPTNKNLMR